MNYKLNIIDKLTPIRKAHQLTDALIERDGITKGKPCKKGCAYCCYQEILVSIPEAMFVISNLVKTPEGKVWLAAHFKRIREHVALVREIYARNPVKCFEDLQRNHEVWLDTKTPCIFLENNICKVYETRPICCRSYFIIGDSSFCGKRVKEKIITTVHIPLAVSAIFTSSKKVAEDLRIADDPLLFPIAIDWALIGYAYGPGGIRHLMRKGEVICRIATGKGVE